MYDPSDKELIEEVVELLRASAKSTEYEHLSNDCDTAADKLEAWMHITTEGQSDGN